MTGDQTAITVTEFEESRTVASFDAIYRAEYSSLVRLAFTLTGRRDIAEELVQDAFESAHLRWDRISTYEKPGAWIRKVVLQRCVGRHRRLGTETRALLRLTARPLPRNEVVIRDEELLRQVRRLPIRQAQVIALVCLEDRAIDEVAELLDCSAITVRTHLRRGRLALAAALELTDRHTYESETDDGGSQ